VTNIAGSPEYLMLSARKIVSKCPSSAVRARAETVCEIKGQVAHAYSAPPRCQVMRRAAYKEPLSHHRSHAHGDVPKYILYINKIDNIVALPDVKDLISEMRPTR
jgi:hypothetical protein